MALTINLPVAPVPPRLRALAETLAGIESSEESTAAALQTALNGDLSALTSRLQQHAEKIRTFVVVSEAKSVRLL